MSDKPEKPNDKSEIARLLVFPLKFEIWILYWKLNIFSEFRDCMDPSWYCKPWVHSDVLSESNRCSCDGKVESKRAMLL
jgi:hypothetical protein